MNQPRIAIYAGSFDPPTNGHLWMIEQGSKLFDKLYVSIGINPEKKYTFTINERISMLKDSISNCQNIQFSDFSNQFLVNYAKSIGANYILRGIRNDTDFRSERENNNINRDINSNITTIFLMPPRDLSEISSSLVKGLIGPKGWQDVVSKYVPKPVFDKLKEKYSQKL